MMDILSKLSAWRRFLEKDIWRLYRRELPAEHYWGVGFLRVLILAWRGVYSGRWTLRASSLAYYSVLSVVPALAMAFGIAQGFGLETILKNELMNNLPGQEEVVSRILQFATNLLEKVRGGVMVIAGLAMLFYTLFLMLSSVEAAFNDIWGVKESRSLGRQIIDYLAMMVIFPFLMLMSGGLNVFLAGEIRVILAALGVGDLVKPFLGLTLAFLPLAVLWFLFTYLYVFMPNTEVNLKVGAVAGIIAGTAYHLFQKFYLHSQIGLSKYNAVYGSFAAIPLFLAWVYFSWLIVLFGAGLSHALQNADKFEFEQERRQASLAYRKRLALMTVHFLIRGFSQGRRDMSASTIAHDLDAPSQLVRQILEDLEQAGVTVEVKGPEEAGPFFQPALDPEKITLQFVLEALEKSGVNDLPLADGPVRERIEENLQLMTQVLTQSEANKRLKDI